MFLFTIAAFVFCCNSPLDEKSKASAKDSLVFSNESIKTKSEITDTANDIPFAIHLKITKFEQGTWYDLSKIFINITYSVLTDVIGTVIKQNDTVYSTKTLYVGSKYRQDTIAIMLNRENLKIGNQYEVLLRKFRNEVTIPDSLFDHLRTGDKKEYVDAVKENVVFRNRDTYKLIKIF